MRLEGWNGLADRRTSVAAQLAGEQTLHLGLIDVQLATAFQAPSDDGQLQEKPRREGVPVLLVLQARRVEVLWRGSCFSTEIYMSSSRCCW